MMGSRAVLLGSAPGMMHLPCSSVTSRHFLEHLLLWQGFEEDTSPREEEGENRWQNFDDPLFAHCSHRG